MYIYGIICHQLNNPLIHLVNQLSKSSNTLILLHVDKKCDIKPYLDHFRSNKKIKFIGNRINVKWGNYSQIKATLELLKEALVYDFKYFSLLSGVDILIKDVFELESSLKTSNKDFIGGVLAEKYEFRVKNLFPEFYFGKEKSFFNKLLCFSCNLLHRFGFFTQKLENLPKLYYGANWFTIRKNTVDYIINYIRENPFYEKAFYHSLCGDELFFQTIIFNSPLTNEIYENNNSNHDFGKKVLRYIDWKTGPDYPRVLDESDFDKMKRSGMLFARKVNADIALDVLEKHFK